MSGVGHFPHEEQPALFNELLLSWLAGLSGR
jgi:pimeloyl-ACP methyl ester carboxylesterase